MASTWAVGGVGGKQETCSPTHRHNWESDLEKEGLSCQAAEGKYSLHPVGGTEGAGWVEGWREPVVTPIPSLLAGGRRGPPVLLCPEDIPSCPVLFQPCLSSCPEGGGGRASPSGAGAGGPDRGRGSGNGNGGGASPPPPRQLGSVILSVADFSLHRRSQLVAAAGPSFQLPA